MPYGTITKDFYIGMCMKKIKETVVVEGKDDEVKLKTLYDVHIIKTNGTHLSEECLKEIRISREINGVIIFTDQDAPGEQIRRRINEAIPGCKNAFLKKRGRKKAGIGVENATEEEIEEALANLLTYENEEETLSRKEFNALGLQGRENSSYLRSILEEHYHLGHGSAKTIFQRLNHRKLTYNEIKETLDEKRDSQHCQNERDPGDL